jgi:asparagine synthetase B (glutamine-hydrolysing)
MCGIAGFADASPLDIAAGAADISLAHQMCDVIRHRGPDDEGFMSKRVWASACGG